MLAKLFNPLPQIKRRKFLLGTYVDIHLVSKNRRKTQPELITLTDKAYQHIIHVEQEMNFYNPHSRLSYINSKAHYFSLPLSADLNTVLTCAHALYHDTDGLFDVSGGGFSHVILKEKTIRFEKPLQIDLGGIAKGFAVDKAFEYLKQNSDPLSLISVNAGGDLRTTENRVLIRNARHNQLTPVIKTQEALATSSQCYTEDNLINPKTQDRISLSAPVSISASSCMIADALTKPVALCPERAPKLLKTWQAHLIMPDFALKDQTP